MVEKSSTKQGKLPVSNFGGSGDFVYGDDGSAFVKETKKESSELPLLQKSNNNR
ncbi:hypothetical protein TVAG_581970 [Trichomonas vaginalis G3]|nr:hypothetical protein TVAG_581970 [Trichomonas vaginalis G3]|eukprot:XP_001289998.1 hypothetical protein [Trichomonas vaginalis G3]